MPHSRVGDAELFGKVTFAGQLDGIPVGPDPGGDGVGHLLGGVLDAGTVCRRSSGPLGLAVLAFFRLVEFSGVHPEPQRVNVAGGDHDHVVAPAGPPMPGPILIPRCR